ncbi:MAG: hypothetical protein DRI95_00615 [Bacteroidetes bacterium]|nr:MAG: hypothetical protein DRI95_00615 [Bacteroidota bacterium]
MINLTKYPVTFDILEGIFKDTFAGFQDVNIEMKREDAKILEVSQAIDNKINVSINTNTTEILVNDYVYIYSKDDGFLYDGSFKVLEVITGVPTRLVLDGNFIGVTEGGYCNYKQNYYVEAKLVNPNNNKILVYPVPFEVSGSNSGNVKINVSQVVDFLKDTGLTESKELTSGRIELKVMYREVWKNNTSNSFILIDKEPIKIVYAIENTEIEKFIKGFEIPNIYFDYIFSLRFLHSNLNYQGQAIEIYYSELDINKNILTNDNFLKDFNTKEFGQLQVIFDTKNLTINENTQFIKFTAKEVDAFDYRKIDYETPDYLTIS